jgi:hypothetical protein
MKLKFSYTTINEKQFFFAENRQEAENMVKSHFGVFAKTQNLKQVKYQLYG